MKLSALAKDLPGLQGLCGDGDIEITDLCIDSRKAEPGALFFCTPGLRMDAHDFAPQAVKNGAVALVVERALPIDCPQVLVESVREATAVIACRFYGHPSEKLIMIGITGTKGKTTSGYLIKSILEQAGFKAGLIGTVGSVIGNEIIPTHLTTPDPLEVQKLLARMVDENVTHVVMEVSAHALSMDRLVGIRYQVGAFTNFSQDHIDLFGDMDAYFKAKMLFFRPKMTEKIVYNIDDDRVGEALGALGRPAIKIGIREAADVYANDIEIGERSCGFILTCHRRFRLPIALKLAGIFNVYNALLAAGVACALKIPPAAIKRGLEAVRNVPGRIELLETETPYRVILDYAHSPDALENILSALRETTKGRMIALFGCGGERDRGKRPVMGEIAGRLADYCVLTSDNPRNEEPMEILSEIEEGIRPTGCEYIVIENRRAAIKHALEIAEAGDVIVLAGKGHETYQEIKGIKHPFDEKIVVAELLAQRE
jgi:UDP-N-acetylmuramoyl-L-alanyl-D-glutamate--2,6-diaminopimelate ligase